MTDPPEIPSPPVDIQIPQEDKRQYVRQLIDRTKDDSLVRWEDNGSRRISVTMLAHSEIRTLSDPALIALFIDELPNNRGLYDIGTIYFAVNHIGSNTHSLDALDFMIRQLRVEKRGWPVDRLVGYIRRYPLRQQRTEEIISAIVPFIGHLSVEYWFELMPLVNLYRDQRIVDALLQALLNPRNRASHFSYLFFGLAEQGDSCAREALEPFLSNPDYEIRLAAISAACKLGDDRHSLEIASFLRHKKADVKRWAIRLLADFGDAQAVSAGADFVTAMTPKAISAQWVPPQAAPVYQAVRYLARFAEVEPAADAGLKSVARRWVKLPREAQEALQTDFPDHFGALQLNTI